MENSAATHNKTSRVTYLIILIVLLSLAGVGFYGWWSKTPASAGGGAQGPGGARGGMNPALSVTAADIVTGDIDIFLTALGTVTPIATTVVRPRVDGQLMKIHFTEGQLVNEGDLLAEIDQRPFLVQLKQAEGQLAKDQASLKSAEFDLQRYETLLTQDSIAKQQVDTQRALVKQYRGTVLADQAQVDNARLQLTYAKVTAPISGRLGMRQVDLGNIVRASDTTGLIVITQEQPTSAVFTIPEDSLPQVVQGARNGDALVVEAYDRQFRNRLDVGVLLSIDNQIDPQTGNIKLRASFPNDSQQLFPNQFVNIKMHVKTLKSVVLAPTAAIARNVSGFFVYVVDENGAVQYRPVTTGASSGDQTVVETGLKAGERIVIDGLDKLRDGMKVAVIDPASRSAAQATSDDTASESGKPRGERGGRGDAPAAATDSGTSPATRAGQPR